MIWLLQVSIVVGIIYLIMVYMEWDRKIMLKYTPIKNLIENYPNKPSAKTRTVLIFKCDDGLCLNTLKSLLDQSIKVDDIAVQTNRPEKFHEYKKLKVITLHKPGMETIREGDENTIIINIKNYHIYSYDEIETIVNERGVSNVQPPPQTMTYHPNDLRNTFYNMLLKMRTL